MGRINKIKLYFVEKRKEELGKKVVTICGISIIVLTIVIGLFLIYKGTGTFYKYGHSLGEFLFSSEWAPMDSASQGGGKIGSAVYIFGSLLTCAMAILIATPFSLAAAIFMA